MKCWGYNADGELGDGTFTSSDVPVSVEGLSSGIRAVFPGVDYTCAITASGSAKCWGYNGQGQLGDGTFISSEVPVDVTRLSSGVAAISAGASHACALSTSGGVKCWGINTYGQLGNGSRISTVVPVRVKGLFSGIASVSAAGDFTCALTISGGVKCWGANTYGQLGGNTGTAYFSDVPVDVPDLPNTIVEITATGENPCALAANGDVHCWGENGLGPGYTFSFGAEAILGNGGTNCIVDTMGRVYCWGSNGSGELGDGTIVDSQFPVQVFGPTLRDIDASVVTGRSITASGQVELTASWTGRDPYAAITSYQLQEQINQGPWSVVTLASPTATSATVFLTSGNSYDFQVQANDSLGRTSVWSPGERFFLNGDINPPIPGPRFRTGTWLSSTLTGAWGGYVNYTTQQNASWDVRGAVTWIGTKGPNYGSADVYVNGALAATVDCYAPTIMKRQTLFSTGDLNVGGRVTIVNLATPGHPRIDIDGFVLGD